VSSERKAIDGTGVSLMVLLCAVWGLGHVAANFAGLLFGAGLVLVNLKA
jgi:hypothetical protein